MKKITKKLFSLLLALSLVLGMFPSSSLAAPLANEKKSETKAETTDEKVSIPSTEAKDALSKEIKVDGLNTTIKLNTSLGADADVEVDEKDPAIKVVKAELKDMKVLNEDGQSVPLTDEQINNILALYQQYLDNWAANANVLGVQTPFFLQYNDEEDSLGALGEMLAMSNIPVAAVRAGQVSYDDLTGMIMNFYYGDALGVQYYGSDIAAARDEAIAAIKASGAQTEAQKLLVLNDWLAHVNTFDMPYIMNADKKENEKPMVAEEPVKQEHYNDVYDVIYDVYKEQIHDQFYNQIYAGIVASIRMDVYKAAIKQVVYDAAYDQAYNGYIAENTPEGGETETPENGEATTPENGEAVTPEGGDTATVADEETGTPEGDDAATEEPTLEEAADAYAKEVATQAAEGFMTENAEAIEADPHQFVLDNFGEEAAAQISAQADAVVADAEKNGMVVDEKGTKMTVAQLTEAQMDVPLDDLNGMTPNQAVPVYADQAAQGLTNGVLNYWEGSHIGALASGTSVCLGYAKAYAYILQYMNPEVYGVNGAGTDMSVSENWKAAKDIYYTDGALDITKGYKVDLVRITFDASVTMYGETQDNFNSDHFWNAVLVDGEWFYVDTCYTDVFTEVMSRDRVETDGSMNHLYFLFSHTSAEELYDGNFKEIKTLYASYTDGNLLAATKDYTSDKYEESWFVRAVSNTYSDGKMFYYVYDSTDMFEAMGSFENADNSDSLDMEAFNKDAEIKLVGHAITNNDVVETSDDEVKAADIDYTTFIEFNYKENEDDETSVARVYNPDTEAMEENELLTKLYAQFEAESEVYPSIAITAAYYEGKLYFNVSNCILTYDLATGEVTPVKEYNTVSGKRDPHNPFGGMAFSVVSSDGDFTVENRPIAGMTIKGDGKMYVSIATNFAFISGKDRTNPADQNSYGYEYEESNFNSSYNDYSMSEDMDSSMLEQFGYSEEINDNDEFMWTANFVDTFAASSLSEAITYQGHECDHHYIRFDETYYTKDDSGAWNTGFCYVCTVCGTAVEEPEKPKEDADYESFGSSYEEQLAEYEKKKAVYDEAVAKSGHVYSDPEAVWSNENTLVTVRNLVCTSVCSERKNTLDCLLEDDTITATLNEAKTLDATITDYEGECTKGVTATHTAEAVVEDTNTDGETVSYKVLVTKTSEIPAGNHAYEGTFEWTKATDEEGNEIEGYTATATATCAVCGDIKKDLKAVVAYDEENSVAPTCTEAGQDIYVATADVVDDDGNQLGQVTGNNIIELKALGHTLTEAADNGDGTHTGTCSVCEESITAEHTFENGLCSVCKLSAHNFVATFKWVAVLDDEGNPTGEYTATATFTCDGHCEEVHEDVKATVEYNGEKSVAPTCTEAGQNVYTATAVVLNDNGEEIAKATDEKEVAVPATGHAALTEGKDNGDGTHSGACPVCNETISEKHTFEDDFCTVCDAPEHEYHAAFEWAEDGKSATVVFTCDHCDDVTDPVEATVTTKEHVDPTCTAAGKDVYTATAVLKNEAGEEIAKATDEKEVAIPATGHAALTEGKDNGDGTHSGACPTCNETISEKHTFEDDFCTVCGAPEHNFTGTIIFARAGEGYTATADFVCSECGEEHLDEEAEVEVISTTNPTCTEDGKKVYGATATLKNEKGVVLATAEDEFEVILLATGHGTLTDAEDNDNGTHTGTCPDCKEKVTENHTIEDGICTLCGAMGHEFDVEFTWTKTGAGYTATATFRCEDCGEVRKDVPAEVTVTETVAATCTETGKKVYTATAVIYNDDEKIIGRGEDKFVEQLPVIDHKYENGVCTECGAIALQAPELLSVYSRVQTSAKSTWTAVEGAEGYELWRATDKNAAESGWIRVKTMVGKDNVVYTNQGLEIGTTYYYKVRAFITDAAGERVYSKFSEVKYMPAAVVITNVYSNATFRLRLLWEEVGGAHGYQIWRKADDGSWKIVKTLGDKGNELTDNQGATTAYSNTGLEAGQTYTYKMRAFMITEDGEKVFGAYSDEFSGAVKPETPVVTGTSSKAGRAVLEWNELSGAAGYQIWMSTSEDGEYSITKSITDSKTTTYTKYELESGKTYYFKVRAYSEVDGRKSFSDYSEVVNVKVK